MWGGVWGGARVGRGVVWGRVSTTEAGVIERAKEVTSMVWVIVVASGE